MTIDIFDKLDWGIFNKSPTEKEFIESEIKHGVYTKFCDVNPGDIVFDIGASIGPFTASILNKNPKEVHCFEPHRQVFDTLKNNLKDYSNIIFNCLAIHSQTEESVNIRSFIDTQETLSEIEVSSITFKDYIDSRNITHIDFLKSDSEGAEWDIFTEENYPWIHKNVKKIVGEFHLPDQKSKNNFIKFRDLYLINAKNVHAYISNKYAIIDSINDRIWNNNFVHENLNYCNISFEFTDSLNLLVKPKAWIVDNFYEDPYKIRQFALSQTYIEGGIGRGFIGRRTEKQFLFSELKSRFEQIMGRSILEWESHSENGKFQVAWSGEPLVYHCDSQKWAGMIYLTPNAPYSCGTSLLAHKVTRARSYHDKGWDSAWVGIPGDCHLDGTYFEPVDVLGNVFNRLVIFDASSIHSASQYFGTIKENGRLWQMFFFD